MLHGFVRGRRELLALCLAPFLAVGVAGTKPAHAGAIAPVKIAFLADQGLGTDAEAVLQLVLDEGADAVLHSGDFDYEDDPAAWEDQIDRILGPDFPYFASVGNHDDALVSGVDESGAYQQRMAARLERIGIPWEGVLGVRSSLSFRGIFLVLTAPGLFGDGDEEFAPYIRERLANDDSIWSISSWHLNMRAMQVGGKSDSTGWGVYDESRAGGAIIATGHEHSYSRTHLLSSCENQTVASTQGPLVLAADEPLTPVDEGRSFVFVSGLGGSSVRDQQLDGDWWASIYTSDQGATHGALFGEFGFDGDPRLAHFYFKDVAGRVADEFFVVSTLGSEPEPLAKPVLACFDAQAKAFSRVSKASRRQLGRCVESWAKSRLEPGRSLYECIDTDPKDKLARAIARASLDLERRCSEPPPPFGSTDPSRLTTLATLVGGELFLLLDVDPSSHGGSPCQAALVKAGERCRAAHLAAYQACRRAGLRAGSIDSTDGLASCLEDAAAATKVQTCDGKLARAAQQACVANDIDLSNAFPRCGTSDPAAFGACARDEAVAGSCRLLAEAEALPDPAGICGLDP